MALSKEEILDAVAGMTVLELSELIKMMEEKFGMSVYLYPYTKYLENMP